MLDRWASVIVGGEALAIVVLLAALLVGQPAAVHFTNDRVNAQATQIVLLTKQVPSPTPFLTVVPRVR